MERDESHRANRGRGRGRRPKRTKSITFPAKRCRFKWTNASFVRPCYRIFYSWTTTLPRTMCSNAKYANAISCDIRIWSDTSPRTTANRNHSYAIYADWDFRFRSTYKRTRRSIIQLASRRNNFIRWISSILFISYEQFNAPNKANRIWLHGNFVFWFHRFRSVAFQIHVVMYMTCAYKIIGGAYINVDQVMWTTSNAIATHAPAYGSRRGYLTNFNVRIYSKSMWKMITILTSNLSGIVYNKMWMAINYGAQSVCKCANIRNLMSAWTIALSLGGKWHMKLAHFDDCASLKMIINFIPSMRSHARSASPTLSARTTSMCHYVSGHHPPLTAQEPQFISSEKT